MRCLKVSTRTLACWIALIASVPTANADLVVSDGLSDLRRFDDSGGFVSEFATFPTVANPGGLAFGTDGDLFVVSADNTGRAVNVVRFDGTTYSSKGAFATGGPGFANLGPGFLSLAFGPSGDLFVTASNPGLGVGQVLRYDGVTGASLGVFTSGGALALPYDLTFGPGGDLFVSSGSTNQVLRYDGGNGNYLGVFASGGGLSSPIGLAFGTDGDLFVSSLGTRQVLRYDGGTGAFEGVFIPSGVGGLVGPYDLAFGPAGDLFVVDANQSYVKRYDGVTGGFVSDFTPGGALIHPTFLAFNPSDVSEAVPEPTSLTLLGSGSLGLLALLRRRTIRANKKVRC